MVNRVANFDPLRARELMAAPWALVLWSFLMLSEHERITGIARQFQALEQAGLHAHAMADPKQLDVIARELQVKVGALPSVEESMVNATEMVAKLSAIDLVTEPAV